jgi:transcriptional regulator with XRE-family HTH domain
MATPHPVDIDVGKRVRKLREVLGITQEQLADHLGISFQQVQKYEKGTNRISASRLVAIAGKLGVSAGSLLPPDERTDSRDARDVLVANLTAERDDLARRLAAVRDASALAA